MDNPEFPVGIPESPQEFLNPVQPEVKAEFGEIS